MTEQREPLERIADALERIAKLMEDDAAMKAAAQADTAAPAQEPRNALRDAQIMSEAVKRAAAKHSRR